MNTTDITSTLETLYSELIDGAPTTGAYMLNRGWRAVDQLGVQRLERAEIGRAHV